jgi:hypothetical protein
MIGRMSAVFFPTQQLASILAMAAAGTLASTALRGTHIVVGSITIGPIAAIIAASGALILLAGAWSIAPLLRATRAEHSPAPS